MTDEEFKPIEYTSESILINSEEDLEEQKIHHQIQENAEDVEVCKPKRANFKGVRIEVVYKGVLRSMRRYYCNKILLSNPAYCSEFGIKQERICYELLKEHLR